MGAPRKCSCDAFCDEPCPVHARENALQNEVLELRNQVAAYPAAAATIKTLYRRAKKVLYRRYTGEGFVCHCCESYYSTIEGYTEEHTGGSDWVWGALEVSPKQFQPDYSIAVDISDELDTLGYECVNE
jgi:hypothetical protein